MKWQQVYFTKFWVNKIQGLCKTQFTVGHGGGAESRIQPNYCLKDSSQTSWIWYLNDNKPDIDQSGSDGLIC